MARHIASSPSSSSSSLAERHNLGFNVDVAAIVLALVFAALIRSNVIHRIGW